MKKFFRTALALTVMVSLLAACGVPKHSEPPYVVESSQPGTEHTAPPEAGDTVKRLTSAPDGARYSSLYQMMEAKPQQSEHFSRLVEALNSFSQNSFDYLMATETPGENLLYAPVSLYVDLAMLAEAANGTSMTALDQVLDPEQNLDRETRALAIRELMEVLNRSITEEDSVSQMSNAFWLREGLSLKENYRERLENSYWADSYTWQPGAEAEANREIGQWVEEKTHELIPSDAVPESIPGPEDVLALLNALYYKSGWQDHFGSEMNEVMDFHLTDGSSIEATFMNLTVSNHLGLKRDSYQLGVKPLTDGATMHFILPNEGETLESVARTETFWADLLQAEAATDEYEIYWRIPKSDIDGKLSLLPMLSDLGLGEHINLLDLSHGIAGGAEGLALSAVDQMVRIKTHEKGIEAAAVTIIMAPTAAPLTKPLLDMTLNRPFYCALVSSEGIPLFITRVDNPVPN